MATRDRETLQPAAPELGHEAPKVPDHASGTEMIPSPGRLVIVPRSSATKLRNAPWIIVLLVIVALVAGGAYFWWHQSLDQLPSGIVSGNGRIEADEIDISTKFAGRIATLLANEGDTVVAGQVVATMDTRDLEASLRRAEAQVKQWQRSIDEASAMLAQQKSQAALAQQQLDRTAYLVERGNATRELLDQRRQQLAAATAAVNAATARMHQLEYALNAANQDVELYNINIKDNQLLAPRDGRIQYRIGNVGEVLPAGGKVMTMIDVQSVYMDIYLSTLDAGRVKVGTEARVVLDAYPNIAIPAQASFIATRSQFTPKTVETRTERDRLMFRVRVRVDPAILKAHADSVRTGLPGIAYLQIDPNVAWPARLQRVVEK